LGATVFDPAYRGRRREPCSRRKGESLQRVRDADSSSSDVKRAFPKGKRHRIPKKYKPLSEENRKTKRTISRMRVTFAGVEAAWTEEAGMAG